MPTIAPCLGNSAGWTKKALQRNPGRRILIVEDNADGRESLRLLLELLGHQVVVAEDGLQGLKMALAERPDVALIDIGLPGLDGYEVARRIRRAVGDRIFLIAQTAYAQAEDRQRAYDAGFDAHLTKPLDLDRLRYWLRVARPVRDEVLS